MQSAVFVNWRRFFSPEISIRPKNSRFLTKRWKFFMMEFKWSKIFPQKKNSEYPLQLFSINMLFAAECLISAKIKRMVAVKSGKNGKRTRNNQFLYNQFNQLRHCCHNIFCEKYGGKVVDKKNNQDKCLIKLKNPRYAKFAYWQALWLGVNF